MSDEKSELLKRYHEVVEELSPTHSRCRLCLAEDKPPELVHHHYGKISVWTTNAWQEHVLVCHTDKTKWFQEITEPLGKLLTGEEVQASLNEARNFRLNI